MIPRITVQIRDRIMMREWPILFLNLSRMPSANDSTYHLSQRSNRVHSFFCNFEPTLDLNSIHVHVEMYALFQFLNTTIASELDSRICVSNTCSLIVSSARKNGFRSRKPFAIVFTFRKLLVWKSIHRPSDCGIWRIGSAQHLVGFFGSTEIRRGPES